MALETGKINVMEFLNRFSFEGNKLIDESPLVLTDDETDLSDWEGFDASLCTTAVPSTSGLSSTSSQRDEPAKDFCVICFIQPRRVLYLPCGHYLICDTCHKEILKTFAGKEKSFELGQIDVKPILRCPACNTPTQNQIISDIYM